MALKYGHACSMLFDYSIKADVGCIPLIIYIEKIIVLSFLVYDFIHFRYV